MEHVNTVMEKGEMHRTWAEVVSKKPKVGYSYASLKVLARGEMLSFRALQATKEMVDNIRMQTEQRVDGKMTVGDLAMVMPTIDLLYNLSQSLDMAIDCHVKMTPALAALPPVIFIKKENV